MMIKNSLYSIFITFLSITAGISQKVSIQVLGVDNELLIGANVTLIHVADSTSLISSTDYTGAAHFSIGTFGRYRLQISYLGYIDLDIEVSIDQENVSFQFGLKEDTKILEEVTIVSRRPMLRQDGEKIIVDPTPLIDVSTNVLEILEVTPGLFVDPDGGIYLGNTSPAAVYINGREQRLGSQDIANLLRSLPPGSIQRIELLRNPSARYDAASSGGIINIVLKKGIRIGRFGSVQAGMNQGIEGNRFAGFSLYSTGDKSGWYVNANFSHDGVQSDLTAIRQSAAPFTLMQESLTRRIGNNGFVGAGFNVEINDRTTFSYDGRINLNFTNSNTFSSNDILSFEHELLSQTSNTIDNFTPFFSHQHDLGTLIKLDTIGSELDFKFSFAHSGSRTAQDYTNQFVFPDLPVDAGEGDIDNNRYFIQFQADLTRKLPLDVTLETGVKGSYLDFGNQSDFFNRINGSLISDKIRSNSYIYSEAIGAGYMQASRILFSNIVLKAGVRGEYTYMFGNQQFPVDTNFTVKRLDWFPYVFLSRRLVDIAGYELKAFAIYRKTLSRPSYQNLNPAIRILDQFNYEAGNPSLAPQFTDNYELNISMNDYPIFAVGRNYTSGIISNVLYNDPVNPALTFNTYDNVGTTKETYFRVVAGIPPVNKYFAVIGAQYNYIEYDGIYSDAPIVFERGSWRMFTFHSFSITKNTKVMASGFMLLNGQMNLVELGNIGQLNLTFSQTFLNKKMQVSVFIRDVLRTMETDFMLRQSDIVFEGERYADNQRVGVNLRYNFGIRNKDGQKKSNPFGFEE
jgi:iron complex outermembrane recepter protein